MVRPQRWRGRQKAAATRDFGFWLAPGSSAGRASGTAPRPQYQKLAPVAIIQRMTLLEITYELQSPLSLQQLERLGGFANTYGLRKFRVDEQKNQITFEYDASRLRDTQVAHALGLAGIAVTRKVN
jgi:hypothetical protein